MAAQAWELYNLAKKKLGNGTIKLGVDSFRMQLFKSTSNASALTQSTISQVTNEVNSGTYPPNGKALATTRWSALNSAKQYNFDSDDVVFSATGSNMTSIQFAVVRVAGASANANHVLMKSKLSTAVFTVNQNNTLTIQIHGNGYFVMY